MTEPRRELRPSLWPHLVLAALAAIWISFSGIHRWHNSDSLLSAMASQYAWTPFFWQQDRVGLLVPLITSLCPDPVFNLVLQTALLVFVGLSLPVLLVERVAPHPVARTAAMLVNGLMIALAPDRIRDNLLMECYYPLAMALGCTALLLLGRGTGWPRVWRIGAAAGLFMLAHWVYVGVAIWLGPLALALGWLQPGEPWPPQLWRRLLRPITHARTLLGCGLIVVGFGVGVGLMIWTQTHDPSVGIPTPRESLPLDTWITAWIALASRIGTLPGMIPWLVSMQMFAGIAALVLLFDRSPRRIPIVSAALVLLIPASTEFLVMGTREWTAQNGYHPRYVLGSIECLQVFWAVLAATSLTGALGTNRRQWAFFMFAAVVLVLASLHQFGPPSLERPRDDLDELTRPWTDQLQDAEVDAFGGNYWIVWPAVYRMNWDRREHGNPMLFIGVTDRGRVLIGRTNFSRERPLRVAVLRNPSEYQWFLTYIPVCNLAPAVKIGDHGPFEIYETYPLDSP